MDRYKVSVTVDGKPLGPFYPEAGDALRAISRVTWEIFSQISGRKRLKFEAEIQQTVPNVTVGT
jgi:hypothetical protein